MTKTELIQYLQSYVHARKQYEENAHIERELNRAIQAKRRAPKKKARDDTFGDIFWPTMGYSVLFAIIYAILFLLIGSLTPLGGLFESFMKAQYSLDNPVATFISDHLIIGPILFFYIPALAFSVLMSIVSQIKQAKRRQKEYLRDVEAYNSGQTDIPRLENEQKIYAYRAMQARQKMTEFESKGILHPSYYEDAERLLEYLVKGRADSLKEALNLLEYDLRQGRQEIDQMFRDAERQEQLERMARMQEDALAEMQDGVDRAAGAAAKAAGFSAASAFYSWQAAERQRKRENE